MRQVVLASVGMVMAESAQAGLMIVSKATMSQGMSSLVFVFYSNAFASLLLLPASLLFNRSQRPPVTFPILCSFFFLALVGLLSQFLGYAGIYYSSPTLGTAMLNLIPGFTFILAVTFRMEKLNWQSFSSIAKSVGTLVSVVGALIITFYKGLPLLMGSLHRNLPYKLFMPQSKSNWVMGALYLAVSCVMGSSWLIVQAFVLEKFQAKLIIIFYYFFFVAVQSAIVCLVLERDITVWSLTPNSRLMAVLYSAFFGSAFQVGICTWCLHRMGPVFVSMFKPLGIVIAVAIQVTLLGDTFYLGSLIGAIVIVAGFYCVLWGKAKEEKMGVVRGMRNSVSGGEKAPLLQNDTGEI